MTQMLTDVLIIILLLQVKHLFADYFLQTPMMLAHRAKYFHIGRAAHVSIHAIGTAAILLLIGTPLWLFAALVIGEWLVHFHIDYWKGAFTEKRGLTPNDAVYWQANGFDQALHQWTYLAMTWLWVLGITA